MAENDIEALAVEQVDRDAANAVRQQQLGFAVGMQDGHYLVQAFARHRLTALRSTNPTDSAAKDAEIATYREALEKIERTPAWGYPDRWETTPAEVRQLARAALANRGEAGALAKERAE